MKPIFRRILMILADALMLMFGYYVSYYLIGFIGRECTDIFISNSYIFAGIKLAVFAVFFMYSLKPERSFLIDVAGIVVANAAAAAVGVFIFKVDILNEILVVSIILAWDLVIGLMIRFLFRSPYAEEDDEDEEFYLNHSDDDDLSEERHLPAPEVDYVQDAEQDVISPEMQHDQESPRAYGEIANPFDNTASFNAEIQTKLDAMLKLIEEKDDKIDMLENKLALQSSMNFEDYAPEEDEPGVATDDIKPYRAEALAAPEPQEDPFYYSGYDQQPQQGYNTQQPYYYNRPQPQQQPYSAQPYPPYQPQQNYSENNKKEIIESILTDIKELYSTLSAKTKALDERERNLLMRALELEQREKTLDRLETEARAAANELRVQASEAKKPLSREISDEMRIPRDNIQLADNIIKTLDDIKNTKQPPFVLAQAPVGETEHSADEMPSRVRPAQNTQKQQPSGSKPQYNRTQPQNTAAQAVNAAQDPMQKAREQEALRAKAQAKAKAEAEAAARARARAEAAAKAKAQAAAMAAQKKAAEEKAKREEELIRKQQERLKSAINPLPKPVKEETKPDVDFANIENDSLNLNSEDLDNISSFLDNL